MAKVNHPGDAEYEWHRNLYLEFVLTLIMVCKAASGCVWYHYTARSNRVDMTAELYFIRLAWDSLIILSCVLYYCLAPVAVMTAGELSAVIILVVLFDSFIAYTCVWRAHEKLKQKNFERSLGQKLIYNKI